MSRKRSTDFLIIGGGIIGLAVARELRRRFPRQRITLIEKEQRLAFHASGRNSGVLHAGFYYTPDSLKARFTRDGNRALTELCLERGLPLRRCGKLVVTRSESELAGLDALYRRGHENGVELQMIDAAAAREIEPRALTVERALFSPHTSNIEPATIVASIAGELKAAGVEILSNCPFQHVGRDGDVVSGMGTISTGFVINAAGLQADRVARLFGLGRHYRMLPFKGRYLHPDPADERTRLRTNIYPVPDPCFPFLGVHLTVTADGLGKIGPTALPAFWLEQYHRLSRFRLSEFVPISLRMAGLVATNSAVRRLAAAELSKTSRRHLVRLASRLATGIHPASYRQWGTPGIRAQLLDLRTNDIS